MVIFLLVVAIFYELVKIMVGRWGPM